MKDFNISVSVNNMTSMLIAKIFNVESHSLVIATRILLGLNKSNEQLLLLREAEQLIRREIIELERIKQPNLDSQQTVSGHSGFTPASATSLSRLVSTNDDVFNGLESAEFGYFDTIPGLAGHMQQNINPSTLQAR